MNTATENSATPQPRKPRKTIRATVLVIALALAGTGAVVVAKNDGRHWRGNPVERMANHLDLTDEQRLNIEAILATSRAEAEPMRAELESLRSQLRSFVETDEFYADQVRIQVAGQSDTMVELMVLGIGTLHAVRSELNPDQLAEADAMLKKFADRRGKRGFGGHFGTTPAVE